MSAARTLHWLILGMWGTAIAGGVLDFALESQLPAPLRDYLSAQWEADFAVRDGVGIVIGLAALWFLIRGSIQLYRLQAAGRYPFLIGSVLSILLMPLLGPAIYNPWSAALYEASPSAAPLLGGFTWGAWPFTSAILDSPLDCLPDRIQLGSRPAA